MHSTTLDRRRFVRVFLPLVLLLHLTAGLHTPLASARTVEEVGLTSLTGFMNAYDEIMASPDETSFVLLNDLTGYITRDLLYSSRVESQVLSPLVYLEYSMAMFDLRLPIVPNGDAHTFSKTDDPFGQVQVFSLEYKREFDGFPFAGEVDTTGWPYWLSSVEWSSANREAVGGEIFVWASMDGMSFPSGFGADGIVFTDDDPLTALAQGWTAVRISSDGFEFSRDSVHQVEIIKGDLWLYDLAHLSFVYAFAELLGTLEVRYPFTDEKGIDWDALRVEYAPRVLRAQLANDRDAFAQILHDFAMSFGDAHVNAEIPDAIFEQHVSGFLGIEFIETSNGELVVSRVWDQFPHPGVDLEVGAQILLFDGVSPSEAIARQQLLVPSSSERFARTMLLEQLSWGQDGDLVALEYRNPGGALQVATLRYQAPPDRETQRVMSQYDISINRPSVLPITAKILDSGVGYIRIASFYDDPVALDAAWRAALDTLDYAGVGNVIIDVRGNLGGWQDSALNLAGAFHYDDPVVFDVTKFDAESGNVVQMPFKVPDRDPYYMDFAILVDADCASACEIFAVAASQSDDVILVGSSPTAGAVSSVSEWIMPGNLYFSSSTTRISLAGDPVLEGVGVAPDVDVAITLRSVQNQVDVVLEEAILAVDN